MRVPVCQWVALAGVPVLIAGLCPGATAVFPNEQASQGKGVFGSVTVHPTGAIGPKESYPEFGRESRKQITLTVSPSGLCWLSGRPVPQGSDDFWVDGASVRRRHGLLYRLERPVGSGLYLSDNAWLASIRYLAPGEAEATLYDSTGTLTTVVELDYPRAFALAEFGATFVVAARGGTAVLNGPEADVLWLPEANRIAVSAEGRRIALVREDGVEVWEGAKRVAALRNVVQPALGACFLNGDTLVVWGRSRAVAYHLVSQQPVWILEAPPEARFFDLIRTGRRLVIGLQTRVEGKLRGEAWLVDSAGKTLAVRQGGEALLRAGATVVSLMRQREFVPWPFLPFDQPRPLGNTYEEYQNYGGEPYLHPGVDMLLAPHTPVYAVAGGVVKAKLTIAGQYHWRLAVADSATTDTTEGWLYAHLVRESIPFEVGDVVRPGDYLGDIVPWPVAGFHHLHFVKVRQAGEEWTPDWEAAFNPLDALRPLADSTAPEFGAARSDGSPVVYLSAETGEVLPADSLQGRVDIIVRVGDRVLSVDWLCSVYRLRYLVLNASSGDTVLGPILAARLSHRLPNYTAGPELTRVLYWDREPFQSAGNFAERVFYHILTNTDGDSLLELADTSGALNCDRLTPGKYTLLVEAADAVGNVAVTSDTFVVRPSETAVVGSRRFFVPDNISLQAFPSPFHDEATVSWALARPCPLRLEIYDVRGRLVRRFGGGSLGPRPRGQWRWDGRDRDGHPVPSGIYLVRLKTPLGSKALRVVRLR